MTLMKAAYLSKTFTVFVLQPTGLKVHLNHVSCCCEISNYTHFFNYEETLSHIHVHIYYISAWNANTKREKRAKSKTTIAKRHVSRVSDVPSSVT